MLKKLLTICLGLIISFGTIAPITFAQEEYTCEDIYKFENLKLSKDEREKLGININVAEGEVDDALKSMPFYVIIEEPMGQDKKGELITCIRKCVVKCELSADLKECDKTFNVCEYMSPSKLEDLKTCQPDASKQEIRVTCERIQVLISTDGLKVFYTYIGVIYRWATTTIGIVCVLIIVFSGIQIMTAGGDTAKIGEAKKHIVQSLVGLVILFLSGLILYTINPTFFV